MSERLRSKLAKIPPNQLGQVKREVIDALREYSDKTGINMPAEVLIVTGAKPS
jgi:hypothetical protein